MWVVFLFLRAFQKQYSKKKKFNNNDNIAEVVEMCLDTDEQDGRRVVLCVCVLLFFSCEWKEKRKEGQVREEQVIWAGLYSFFLVSCQ